MRVNAIPFVFLPGVVLIGYLVNGWGGAVWATASWGGMVLIGTVLALRRHLHRRRDPDWDDWDDAAPSRNARFW